jgi:hypothetical protein
MRRRHLAPLALALLAASGCAAQQKDSSGKFPGEGKAVATTVEELQKAGRAGDAERICNDLLAPELVKRMRRGRVECATLLKDTLDDADQYDLNVKKVDVQGGTATATVTSGTGDHKRDDTLTLVKDRGRWKLSSLGG